MHSLVYFVSQRLQFCQSKADTNNWLKGIKRKKRHGAGRDIKEIKEEKDKEKKHKDGRHRLKEKTDTQRVV